MIVYLVIDDSKDVLKKYDEQYRLFTDFKEAARHANSCGYDFSWMSPSDKVGVRNNYMCGDKNITLITLDTEHKNEIL